MHEVDETLKKVYLRLHNFFFNKCGFVFPILADKSVIKTLTDLNGKDRYMNNHEILESIRNRTNYAFSPNSVYAILGGISVSNIKHAKSLIVACKTMDMHYTKRAKVVNGRVLGFVSKKLGFPMFHLFIWYDNKSIERLILPQNPFKQSGPAEKARNGERISWVMNPTAENYKERWVANCIGKDYIHLINEKGVLGEDIFSE